MSQEPGRKEFQALWLKQLYHEYEDICLSYGVALRTPVFEITDSRSVYGCWHAETGILSLSRKLIMEYPWPVTLQVLKHEMAHQLCSEWPGFSGTAHGEQFQSACERLGVLPEFRHPGVVISQMVDEALTPSQLKADGRRCLARIKKLLALGRSANEHEAAQAMKKANELLEKYHLRGIAEGGEHRFASVVIDRKKKRISAYQKHICSILQEYFFVRVVLSQLYDPLCDDSFKTIELFGSAENVAVAEYCYHFLANHLAFLWSINRDRFKGSARTEKNSYYLGLLRGFREKLSEQRGGRGGKTAAPAGKSLIVAEEQRLSWYVGMRFPRLRKVSARGARVYGATYQQGVEEGGRITMNEGIAVRDPGPGGLLPC